MNYIEIGNKGNPKASAMMVSLLIRKEVKTTNIPLAIAVSKVTGEAPAEYLSTKIKNYAIKVNPKLSRKPRTNKSSA